MILRWLLFLDQRDLKESDVDSFVDDVLVNDKPEDVRELLDQHIGKGKIIERLWRFVCFQFCLLSSVEKFTGTEASVVIFSLLLITYSVV